MMVQAAPESMRMSTGFELMAPRQIGVPDFMFCGVIELILRASCWDARSSFLNLQIELGVLGWYCVVTDLSSVFGPYVLTGYRN
jgi:hypothetical protein